MTITQIPTKPTAQRVALLTNIPRPYRIPLYEAISREITALGGAFKVFFYSDVSRHARRQNGGEMAQGRYDQAAVAGFEIALSYEKVLSVPLRLPAALHTYRPDVLICGAFGLVGSVGWLYTRLARLPYVQWSGATAARRKQNSAVGNASQRFLAAHADACISYGSAASAYLVEAGARSSRVVTGVNAVDGELFAQQAAQAQDRVAELKASEGLGGVNLLYAGGLLALKGLSYVLQALGEVKDQLGEFHLHLVGAGPQEAELRAAAERLGLTEQVRFWGARPAADMPLFYALADIFVFPSLYDVWGLVLNEAMACGVPAIASPLAGATQDLIEDGVNGLIVDPRDTSALSDALRRLVLDSDLRQSMGAAAGATIQRKATIDCSAHAFMTAIELVS